MATTTRRAPRIDKRREFESPVMDIFETAEFLRCHISTIYRLIGKGGLPWFRVGSDYRFDRRKIEEWTRR